MLENNWAKQETPIQALYPLPLRLLRFLYHHFYNRFAFTYDAVSRIVSRGEWRAWTNAALPFVRGARVLEVAFGTGNLFLDLCAACHQPVGIDSSPYMIALTQRKLRARNYPTPLARARAQQLPFPSEFFDTVIMTFPPGFGDDPRAMDEIRRVLAAEGRLVWVDAPYLYPRDAWTRVLNWAYRVAAGIALRGNKNAQPGRALPALLPRAGWHWRIERVARAAGYVHVMLGTKVEAETSTAGKSGAGPWPYASGRASDSK